MDLCSASNISEKIKGVSRVLFPFLRHSHRLAMLGRVKNSIELEITLDCNAFCSQCSRHCNILDYGDTSMSVDQVDRFICQVIESGKPLRIITVIGGEPSLHPELSLIVNKLYDQLVSTGRVGELRIATNGIRDLPDDVKDLPIVIIRSPLSQKKHRCQFVAPKDTGQETRFCNVPYSCGMALNVFGYFPCGAGGAIIRLFKMDKFTKYRLPDNPESFIGFREEVCPLCQASAEKQLMEGVDDCTPSSSFQMALADFREEPPSYPRF